MSMHVTELGNPEGDSVVFLHGGNVASWMWGVQLDAVPEFHAIVPDLPGFGASNTHPWVSLADTADQVATLIRERANGGAAHVIGLSLGAMLGTVLVARHPDVVRSAMLTGAPVNGVPGFARWSGMAQLRFWGNRAYWKGLARAFRMPEDSVDLFVETGLGIDVPSARRMMTEVYDGIRPHLAGLEGSIVPLLVLAGEKEHGSVAAAFPEFTSRTDSATCRIVPRMHHAWNAEDPELFNRIMREWLLARTASAELCSR